MRIQNYKATEIRSSDCNCDLSKYDGKRLLESEFKALVKKVGVSRSCQCQLIHYDDRRANTDRRKLTIESVIFNGYRRNRPFGRRAVDIARKRKYEKMLDNMQFVA